MGLLYYPQPGEIVFCRYDAVVIEPEMRKPRPAVVVSPRLRRRGKLVTIVPLSTTDPDPVEAYHYRFELAKPLPVPFDAPLMWAKCDMIACVSIDRLDRFKEARARGGARRWKTGALTDEQLRCVRAGVLHALGFPS